MVFRESNFCTRTTHSLFIHAVFARHVLLQLLSKILGINGVSVELVMNSTVGRQKTICNNPSKSRGCMRLFGRNCFESRIAVPFWHSPYLARDLHN